MLKQAERIALQNDIKKFVVKNPKSTKAEIANHFIKGGIPRAYRPSFKGTKKFWSPVIMDSKKENSTKKIDKQSKRSQSEETWSQI